MLLWIQDIFEAEESMHFSTAPTHTTGMNSLTHVLGLLLCLTVNWEFALCPPRWVFGPDLTTLPLCERDLCSLLCVIVIDFKLVTLRIELNS